ncbi:phage tail protein [Mannheimia granulomatis]|uniref:Phage tail protein n=1 Tax=Mannheimia granulomatis TaxID=85402 RepID=A0A6G8JGJ3_9PAST|nr:phage tail assembly protein [Mannheimia granulomatis]QIM66332.1 phage tail protein [Mannheimia granulomatis]
MSEKLNDIAIFRKVTLDFPIKDGHSNDVTELKIRRAKAKDLRTAQSQKNEADQEFYLLAILTGLTIEDIAELDIADYSKLQAILKEMQKGKSA